MTRISGFPLALLLAATVMSLCGAPARAASASVPRYHRFEASFTVPGQTGNPYDPVDNDVDVDLAGPHGESVVVPAFWDGARWRVRYTPDQVGGYKLSIKRNGQVIFPPVLSTRSFTCTQSGDPGFIRRDANVVQRFVFDNGAIYYPLGIDVAWTNNDPQSYPVMFGHLRNAHMNWARVWMNAWDGKNLEWAPNKADSPKIGEYYLAAAAKWDQIMDLADHDGVYVQMTLQHHGQYTRQVNPNWDDNPFNVANGGFLQNPDDFFTNPRAIALTKAKYRYIVARWGYSTHLLSFELFNEVQNIKEASNHFQDVVAWHKLMAAYIRSIDPYHHLITSSYTPPDDPLAKSDLDYLQLHDYVPDIVSSIEAVPYATSSLPIFIGEWGTSGAPVTTELLHNAIWASIATPAAGAAEFWSWDQMDALHGWPEYRSAGAFLLANGAAVLRGMQPVDIRPAAPGQRADLSFAPPLNWAPSTTKDVFVGADGRVTGMEGMSCYLQGNWNRKMNPYPIAFHLNAAGPCRFTVAFGQSGAGGSHPTIVLDGNDASKQDLDFPASSAQTNVNQTVSLEVPAGKHIVSLINFGQDWVTITRVTISNYAPAIAVVGRGNARSAMFWAYARSGESTIVKGATLSVPGLSAGTYVVKLWNPREERALPSLAATCRQGILSIRLPRLTGDLAGVAIKQ